MSQFVDLLLCSMLLILLTVSVGLIVLGWLVLMSGALNKSRPKAGGAT